MSDNEFVCKYRRTNRKKILFALSCGALAVAVFFISIGIGQYDISFSESFRLLIAHLTGNADHSMGDNIVWNYRLPRLIMAFFAGMGLAVCGAVMQSILRNPLAEPYTLGISSGASFGATLAIISGVSIVPAFYGQSAVIVNAFLFSLIPLTVILLISRFKKVTPTSMILIGIAVMYVFSSTTTLMMVMADPKDLADIYAWNVGTLGKATWGSLLVVVPVTSLATIVLISSSKMINTLSAGDSFSKMVGLHPERFRLIVFLIVALCTCAIVCFTGTIGFVGLVAPHIVRIFIGSNNQHLLPATAMFGGVLLMVLDVISKMVSWNGLPVGVISALVGGPLFILVLIRNRRKVW